MFDKKCKQFLTKSDLSGGLEDLELKITNKELNLIFYKCDKDRKGFLRCSDLSYLFLPF